MLTFKQLIDAGVAPAPYKNIIAQGNQERDWFLETYNNIWGVVTDTHMSKTSDGGYIITGQLFRDADKTSNFIYACTWCNGAYRFKDSSAQCESLNMYAQQHHYTISHEKVNGDDALVLRPFTDEQIEYYNKYLAPTAVGYNCVCASVDYKKREEAEKKHEELAKSFNFRY